MPDVHAQSIDKEDESARLDCERMRLGSFAGDLHGGAEPPRQRINPRTIESPCGARDDVFASSRCGDRLDQSPIDSPSLFAISGRNGREIITRQSSLSCRRQTRKRFECSGKRRFAELCPQCIAADPMTLFQRDDFRCRLAVRKLRLR